MSNAVVDWGFGGKKYHSESTDEMNEQIRILIESIKDDSIVNMDTESFTITGYPKKTATQNLQITTTTSRLRITEMYIGGIYFKYSIGW